jgi:hypothetical protein
MKNINKSAIFRYIGYTMFFVFLLGVLPANGQDDPIKSRMSLTYLKDSGQNKILKATVKFKKDKKWQFATGENVVFSMGMPDDEELELGTAITNDHGEARFLISKDTDIYVDTTNNISLFLSSFGGNDELKGSSSDIEIQDIVLKLKLEVIDSVKTVYLEANEINFDGELIPIEECDVTLFVPRLYSNLPIEEGLIEEGAAEFDFPDGVPGRDNGELFVLAKILEHDAYGSVEIKEEVNWGTPVAFVNEELPESLFGKAPSWMGILIFGILIAAWYHLFLVVFKLFKLKKLDEN